MRALWMMIKFLLFAAIAFLGGLFAMSNDQQISVDFILFVAPTLSIGLWLLAFLVLGCTLGIVASASVGLRDRENEKNSQTK